MCKDVLRTHLNTACHGEGGSEMQGQRKDKITSRNIAITNWTTPTVFSSIYKLKLINTVTNYMQQRS